VLLVSLVMQEPPAPLDLLEMMVHLVKMELTERMECKEQKAKKENQLWSMSKENRVNRVT